VNVETAIVGGAALLLLAAGLAKGRDPVPTEQALAALGWPSRPPLVRLLAVAEIVIAIGTLLGPVRWFGAALGLLHIGFAVFVVGALARDTPLSSCGCFGRADTPPTPVHVVANAVIAAVALLAAAADAPSPYSEWGRALGPSAASLALSVATAAVGYLVLAVLPRRR
jgi:uncharacterized membrane protein YphA (DoxX/SURF4 family)